ncbi:MAG: succinylglutamate desuccinylase/aspartoacylase family protein [Clostridia bacterium]|nr:succinylglutamate desuccinylase/aspartoacylase family protein [Clostridia bacterium]
MAILKEKTVVASVKMPIGETWTVARCRYRSDDGATARVCLATGIHGDERMGQLVVYDVARRIKEQPEHLHGIVDMYPMLNSIGLDVGQRMVPSSTMLDMNRAFPGVQDGTALESICYAIVQDMKGADLVMDIHTSSQITSELYGVRVHERHADVMLPGAAALCPELIWVLPDKPVHNASLAGALTQEDTHACVLMVDERRLHSQMVVDQVVDGIFCKLHSMGIWSGEVKAAPALADIPCMFEDKDICRVTCTRPGMFVPNEVNGSDVKAGDVLGTIFDAMEGEAVETVIAPEDGLVFTQRRYSAVYPGTLIARLCRKERA